MVYRAVSKESVAVILTDEAELKQRVTELTGRKIYGKPIIKEDCTQYMSIAGGMVLRLAGNDYFVLTDAKEGRFGIDEQPKFWVKYAVNLETGESKIIKLVFHEESSNRFGRFLMHLRRDPAKESRILELVRGQPHCMQGHTVEDAQGGPVRIIDLIRGKSLYRTLIDLEVDHEQYVHEVMPEVLERLVPVIEAIAFLARHDEHHGDIRNDHIIIETGTGLYRWIDFDFWVNYPDFDLWSLGNVLNFVAGKGIHTFQTLARHPELYPHYTGQAALTADDALFLHKNRVANLHKLFPYMPEALNRIVMRFAVGATEFYTDFRSLTDDVNTVVAQMKRP
jgi:hypothetical protein